MADHPGLDDDATVGGEQTAAAECGPASPERRTAAPRTTPRSGRRTWFDARLSRGAQNLVDEALAAVSIADALQQDLEFVVVAAHGGLWYCCMAGAEKSLEKSSFLSVSGSADRPAPRGKLSHVNGLAPRGGHPFYLAVLRSVSGTSNLAHSSTRRRSFVIAISAQTARHGRRHNHVVDIRLSGCQRDRLNVVFLFASGRPVACGTLAQRTVGGLRHDRKEGALAGAFIIVRRGGWKPSPTSCWVMWDALKG
jgi:hypothetical protein